MRFYEYESKALFAQDGVPLGEGRHGARPPTRRRASRPRSAARRAEDPGAHRRPHEGRRRQVRRRRPTRRATAAAQILPLEINGQKPRGVLVEAKPPVAQEYFAGVTWDGRREAARRDLQRHGRHRHRGGRREAPRPRLADALLDAPAAPGVQRKEPVARSASPATS